MHEFGTTREDVKQHCAQGRCTHSFYKNMPFCPNFRKLCASGKNPTECLCYDHRLDYAKTK